MCGKRETELLGVSLPGSRTSGEVVGDLPVSRPVFTVSRVELLWPLTGPYKTKRSFVYSGYRASQKSSTSHTGRQDGAVRHFPTPTLVSEGVGRDVSPLTSGMIRRTDSPLSPGPSGDRPGRSHCSPCSVSQSKSSSRTSVALQQGCRSRDRLLGEEVYVGGPRRGH